MANSPVQTTQAGMQQAAQAFGQTATDFTNELQQINTMMASLQSTWTGTASRSFNTAMDSWEASFKAIIDKLINMMETMGVNTKEYVSAEEDADSVAQSFVASLPGV